MERKFTDITNQVDEIYDGFYQDTKDMLWIAERDIPYPKNSVKIQYTRKTQPILTVEKECYFI